MVIVKKRGHLNFKTIILLMVFMLFSSVVYGADTVLESGVLTVPAKIIVGTPTEGVSQGIEVDGDISGDRVLTGVLVSHPTGPLTIEAPSGVVRVTIDQTTGGVGIGKAPSGTRLLDVNGEIQGDGFCLGTDCISTWSEAGLTSTAWVDGGTDVYLANIGDQVGIGTETPDYALDVVGDIHASGNILADGQMCFGIDCISSWAEAGAGGGDIRSYLNDATLLSGNNYGYWIGAADTLLNIGDEISSPAVGTKVIVIPYNNGAGGVNQEITWDGSAWTGATTSQVNSADILQILNLGSSQTLILAWDRLYPPFNDLALSDTLKPRITGGTVSITDSSGNLGIVVEDGGNVGIGTTVASTEKLEVIGNIKASGDVIGGRLCAGVECISSFSDIGGIAHFVGKTTATTNGNIGSYAAANTICDTQYSGSHVCTVNEVLDTINSGDTTIPEWTETAWIVGGPPGFIADANDCLGWTSSSGAVLGRFWDFDDTTPQGMGWLTNCGNSKQLACCKVGT